MEFEIVEFGCVLEEGSGGWKMELNKVSWYGKPARWEIRSWNEDHTKCSKGVGMSDIALANLRNYLEELFPKEDN